MIPDVSWTYRGHICEITLDEEEDNCKAWHHVTTPFGKRLRADICPYDRSCRTLELWIEAGYPTRGDQIGPLDRSDLKAIVVDRICQEVARS